MKYKVFPNNFDGMDLHKEPEQVDYEVNPTKLYRYIEKKNWKSVIQRCYEYPHEAAITVFRLEKQTKKIKWSQLPIHASVIFQANGKAVTELIKAYPKGLREMDDQGMLPIHLAFRYNATEIVINMLLDSYPESVHVKDKKGRIPLMLTRIPKDSEDCMKENTTFGHYENPLRIYLLRYPLTARESITKEQKSIYDLNVRVLTEEHENELKKIKTQYEEKIKNDKNKFSAKLDIVKDEINQNVIMLNDAVEKIKSQEADVSMYRNACEKEENELKEKIIQYNNAMAQLSTEKQEKLELQMAYETEKEESRKLVETLTRQYEAEKDSKEKLADSLKTLNEKNAEVLDAYMKKAEQLQTREKIMIETREKLETNHRIELEALYKETSVAISKYERTIEEKDRQSKEFNCTNDLLLYQVQELQQQLLIEKEANKKMKSKLGDALLNELSLMNRIRDLTDNLVKRSVEKKDLIKNHERDMQTLQSENWTLRQNQK